MTLRRVLFWVHFSAGSLAGIVILIMSVSGVLLAYERQITAWVDHAYRSHVPYPGAARMEIGTLLANACASQPSVPTAVTVHANPELPIEISFGRARTLYFDSYTGGALGVGSQRTRRFFESVEAWHRWLGMPASSRGIGRMVTGICNLAFFLLVSTGLFLWWPRSSSWTGLKPAITLRWNLRASRARDWNMHTVIGFWCAGPLLVIVLCGVVMSFPWANNLLYRLGGNMPPPPSQGPFSSAASTSAARHPRPMAGADGPKSSRTAVPPESASRHRGDRDASELTSNDAGGGWDAGRLNRLWDRAESQVPGWQTITLRGAPNLAAPKVFLIDRGQGGRPDLRSQLTLDGRTGETERWEPFSSYNLGRRLRAWVRFTHTGEAAGLLGQTIAALAAAAATVLAFTGLAMAWRRACAWLGAGLSAAISFPHARACPGPLVANGAPSLLAPDDLKDAAALAGTDDTNLKGYR